MDSEIITKIILTPEADGCGMQVETAVPMSQDLTTALACMVLDRVISNIKAKMVIELNEKGIKVPDTQAAEEMAGEVIEKLFKGETE